MTERLSFGFLGGGGGEARTGGGWGVRSADRKPCGGMRGAQRAGAAEPWLTGGPAWSRGLQEPWLTGGPAWSRGCRALANGGPGLVSGLQSLANGGPGLVPGCRALAKWGAWPGLGAAGALAKWGARPGLRAAEPG